MGGMSHSALSELRLSRSLVGSRVINCGVLYMCRKSRKKEVPAVLSASLMSEKSQEKINNSEYKKMVTGQVHLAGSSYSLGNCWNTRWNLQKNVT